MLQKLRKLRTNENVLIAVDVLLYSKSSFVSIFLMAFMMRTSLKSAPDAFITYNIMRYSGMAILSLLLMKVIAKHPLAAWRTSMFFSIVQITSLILLPRNAWYFVPAVALASACESTLYWRPKMYFDSTEVSDDRRLRFKSFGRILIEIAKIIMPIILGIAIVGSSYSRAGRIIFVISVFQFLLSILFRPTVKPSKDIYTAKQMRTLIDKHSTLRRMLAIQFVRGMILSCSAYLVISEIHLYRNFSSDFSLGVFTAAASLVTIILVSIYRALGRHERMQKAILYSVAPAAALIPLVAYCFKSDPIVAAVLYIFTQSVIESFIDGVVVMVRLQDILHKHIKEPIARLQMESISESALTLGRITTQGMLLVLCVTGYEKYMLLLAIVEGVLIFPAIYLLLPAHLRKK